MDVTLLAKKATLKPNNRKKMKEQLICGLKIKLISFSIHSPDQTISVWVRFRDRSIKRWKDSKLALSISFSNFRAQHDLLGKVNFYIFGVMMLSLSQFLELFQSREVI
jgi:hypothetical protein